MTATSPQTRDAAAARTRLNEIDAELRRLRGAPPTPLARPEPLSPETARAVLSLLAESAVHHVVVNEADHARRAIGDAIALMTDTTDPATAARASLLMGETLIELDSAKHAEDQLQRAVQFYDRVGDKKLASRARLALGRAMVLLDQPAGMDLLQQVLDDYLATADVAGVARVQTIFAELNRGADAAETIRAGYGRSVSMLPLPPTKPPPGRGGSMPPRR
ncbi:MAG: hypothetical protein JST00_43560 [Deltaproteobacteria bacterium]|nr:hypothetical protein [Deltaproteobacteria bacterium]